ncbi:MAG TPA: carboxypeptidase regulatory-like domain-containing protein [Candidatus Obscuribacterales bacterium]
MMSRSLIFLLLLAGCQEPVLNDSQQDLTQSRSQSRPPQAVPSAVVTDSAALGGIVRDGISGKLISGATVRLDTRATESDQAGFYQFAASQKGEFKLIVLHPDYQPYTETLQLDGTRRIHDVQLTPLGATAPPAASSSPGPVASPTPILLLPNGSTASPGASPTASPLATPSVSPTATPVPTASPAYDPLLDEAVQAEVLIKRHPNGLELVFLLQRSNGQPVNWEWGEVQVQYFLADNAGQLLTNGGTVLNAYGESFVVSPSNGQVPDQVQIQYTLTLPDHRQIEATDTVTVS